MRAFIIIHAFTVILKGEQCIYYNNKFDKTQNASQLNAQS